MTRVLSALGAMLILSGVLFAQGSVNTPLGVYNSTPPTLSNGQQAQFQLDSAGNLNVNVKAGSSGNGAASNTGTTVPTQADYQGINIGGTLRGRTGVNPSGSIYAAQTDVSSIAGSTVATAASGIMKVGLTDGSGNAINSTSNALNVDVTNSSLAVTESGTWNVGLNAGTNLIGYTRAPNACSTTAYEAGMQYLPSASTSLTATATCVTAMVFNNKDTASHQISVQDQSTNCNTAACQVFTSFTLPPGGFLRQQFDGDKFVGGIKWNADAANVIVADVIGNQ